MTLTSTGPTNGRTTLLMDTSPVVKRIREIQAEIEAMDEAFDLSKATEEAARDAEEYRAASPRPTAETEADILYRFRLLRQTISGMESQLHDMKTDLGYLFNLVIKSRDK
jgi:type II secretory pathway component PulM